MKLWVVVIVVFSPLVAASSASSVEAEAQDAASIQIEQISLDSGWRRTALGWEQRSWFCPKESIPRASYADFPHPAIIAALQMLLSLAALVGLGSKSTVSPAPPDAAPDAPPDAMLPAGAARR